MSLIKIHKTHDGSFINKKFDFSNRRGIGFGKYILIVPTLWNLTWRFKQLMGVK